jgi:hypothetical protein
MLNRKKNAAEKNSTAFLSFLGRVFCFYKQKHRPKGIENI